MRNQSGQSLLELMVSIVIITSALAGIIAIFPFIIQKNLKVQKQTEAVNVAQSEIEKLRSLSYFDQDLDALGSLQGMSVLKNIDNYLVRIVIKYVDPKSGEMPEEYPLDLSQDTGLKKVEVSVKRKDGIGGQVNFITFLSRARPGKG